MPHLHRRLASLVVLLAAIAQVGCGGVTTPDSGIPADIEAVGDPQTGPAGGTLSPIVVRVTDGHQRPVANQNVVFAPVTGSGSVDPASARTDGNGRASTSWTLGPTAGKQSLVARAEGGSAPAGLRVTIEATAFSGAATDIEIVSGDEQTGPVGSALPDSLVARVLDAGGNPVAGIEVQWSVSGGGSISPETVVSDGQGLAAAERVLGPNSGPQAAQATAPGLNGSPLTFIHTAEPASPNRLLKVSGDGQSAPAGFQLGDSLVVRLVDENDNGVGGRSVTWVVGTGEGSVEPVNSVTTPQGYAITRWTMPATSGVYTIDAVFSGVNPVSFSGTATSDLPTKLELVSGDGQSASVGGQLAAPLRVKVTDANGNPVENVGVTWTANTGGSVSATSTGTDAQGIAQVNRTLGLLPGTYTTTAAVDGLSGSPVTFTSTATVGSAAKLVILTQPSATAQSGVPLETQPVVQLQDAFGNNVAQSGRAIVAGVTGGTVSGGTASTDGTGKATFTSLAINGAAGSTFKLTFTSGLLVPATSEDVTLGVGDAAKIGFEASPSSSVQAGVVWPQQPIVQLLDAGGNPVPTPDVNVVAEITAGGGTLNGTKTVATDASGRAVFTDLRIDGLVGARTVRFRVPAITGASMNRTVTVTAGSAAKISAVSATNQSGSAGEAVGDPPEVLVQDAFNNPVGGIPVTFAVTQGGGTIAPSGGVNTGPDGHVALTSWTLGSGPGTNTVTATATGLTASPVTFTATAASVGTTTSVSDGSPAPSVVGQSVDFTVTVAPTQGSGTPTGTVVFRVDGADQPGKTLSGGQATLSFTFTSAGSHTVGAAYAGNGTFAASSDATPASQTVNKAATTVAVQSDQSSPAQGDEITFTATIAVAAPGAGTPTGTVTFTDDQGADLGGAVTVSGGVATLKTSALLEGPHTITAQYSGDGNFEPSSGSIPQSVGAAPDSAPIGMGESFNTNEDTPLTTDPGGGVLANDSDPDGDPITAVLVTPPQHSSTFSLNQNGSFSYQPAANYNGADAFTYRVSANGKTSGVLTASITVAPVNDPPVATDDDAGPSLLGAAVSQAAPGVLGNDSDVDSATLTAVLDQGPSHGQLTLNPDGSFSYTPDAGYTGPDSFQYHATDGTASSASATVTFLVVLSL